MSDLAVKYHFQVGKDNTTNLAIFPAHEHKIGNVGELILVFLKHNLACRSCHFRFKDVLEGCNVWVDIKNPSAPLPYNKNNEVELKILKLAVPSHFQANPVKTPPEQTTQQRKTTDFFPDDKTHSPPNHTSYNSAKQTSYPPSSDFNFLDGMGNHREHTVPVKQIHFISGKETETKPFVGTRPNKTPEHLYESTSKKQAFTSHSHSNDKDLEDFFGGIPKKTSFSEKPKSQVRQTDKPSTNNEFDDIMDLEVNDFVSKQPTYSDLKENEALRQKQKMESSGQIDPKIREWAYKNNLQKDLRSLLSSLHEMMPGNETVWKRVELGDILSEGALRKVTLSAIINLHPDKHQNADPAKLYLFQRVVEEINKAFQVHKSQNKA